MNQERAKSRLAAAIAGTLAQHDVAVRLAVRPPMPECPMNRRRGNRSIAGRRPEGYFCEPLADSGPQLQLLSTWLDRHAEDSALTSRGGPPSAFQRVDELPETPVPTTARSQLDPSKTSTGRSLTLAMLGTRGGGLRRTYPLLVVATFARLHPTGRPTRQPVGGNAPLRRRPASGSGGFGHRCDRREFVPPNREVNPRRPARPRHCYGTRPAATVSSSPNCSTT